MTGPALTNVEGYAPLVDDILDTVETEVFYVRGSYMRDLLAEKVARFVAAQEGVERIEKLEAEVERLRAMLIEPIMCKSCRQNPAAIVECKDCNYLGKRGGLRRSPTG